MLMNGDHEKGQSALWELQRRTGPVRTQRGEQQTPDPASWEGEAGAGRQVLFGAPVLFGQKVAAGNAECACGYACTVCTGVGGMGAACGRLPAVPFRVTLPGQPFLSPDPLPLQAPSPMSPKFCNT